MAPSSDLLPALKKSEDYFLWHLLCENIQDILSTPTSSELAELISFPYAVLKQLKLFKSYLLG